MRWIYTIPLLFLAGLCKAQTPISLLLQRLQNEKDDAARAGLYDDVSSYYLFQNADSATYYAEKGRKEFAAKKQLKQEARMYVLLATVDIDQGRTASARERFLYALEMSREVADNQGQARAHNGLGILDVRDGRYKDAGEHFYTALSLYGAAKDTVGLVKTYLKIGTLDEENGRLDNALERYNTALNLARNIPVFPEVLIVYNNIGNVYFRKGDVEKAKHYYTLTFEKKRQARVCRQQGDGYDKPGYIAVRRR